MGRSMHNFDFASAAPLHTSYALDSSPAYYLVLLGRYAVLAVCAGAIPGIVAGIGLLGFRPWGRSVGIIVSTIDILLLDPVHLLLGIYGLVILLKDEAKREF